MDEMVKTNKILKKVVQDIYKWSTNVEKQNHSKFPNNRKPQWK